LSWICHLLLNFHNRINVVRSESLTKAELQSLLRTGILPHIITNDDGSTHVEWVVEELIGHQEMKDKDGFTYHYEDGTPYLEYVRLGGLGFQTTTS
jgi:hypothetical protein